MNAPKPPAKSHARPAPIAKPSLKPLSEAEMERLQSLLDKLPAPLEPLDISMLDGYLCGVLLQPKAVSDAQWLPAVFDSEGREPPAGLDLAPARGLILRRHKELNQAIANRQWFDPWVFELDEEADLSETLMPWVAGFALATELFPALMQQDGLALLEPLAMLYMHLDPEDLEDADELLEEIESLEPPEDLEAAVESLVVATLLLADVSRPQREASMKTAARRPPPRKGPPRGRY
ncbi:YecA family protein [Pelomonas sp. SE-A7]|uniref:YecA/YgfB family protein n=1 Tax=Pelomonas sp. SE-A7 TaxID=3054953 RepID=UPI00259C6A0B|nr:YecA family protein [Pelomonas sp. SE-A7]MDM4768360.1 YecA family protein [Pelomonas sp. SE-A7]